MSMNLYAKINGVKLDLWQTPTYITYICLMHHDGIHNDVTGQDAVKALMCYQEWVSHNLDGVWTDEEEYEFMKERVDYQISLVNDAIQKYVVSPDSTELVAYYL